MTRRRMFRRSIFWHTFFNWVPKVIRRSYGTSRNVGEGVQLGRTQLNVILGRHCASALSRLKKAASHICSIEGQARLLAPAYYLVDFGLHSQGDVFFLRPRQARARSSAQALTTVDSLKFQRRSLM